MSKKFNFVMLTISIFVFLIQVQSVSAIPITMKHFHAYSATSIPSRINTAVTDPNNFGPAGIVNDMSIQVENISEITTENLTDVDILLTAFPYRTESNAISYPEAQMIYDYVNQGGSLIVTSDYGHYARFYSTRVTRLFNTYFGSNLESYGSTTILERTIAPEITNGPFGDIDHYVWRGNATGNISLGGDSTILDSARLLSVITPTSTSGSVVFFGDTDLFYTESYLPLVLNIISYSGKSSHTNNPIPEPATMALFGLGLLGLAGIGRRKTSHIQN